MARDTFHTFTVVVIGQASFPTDMLRYDGLHPSRESDSRAIDRANNPTVAKGEAIRVELKGVQHRQWQPQTGRWNSYQWQVESVTRGEKL